VRPPVPIVWEEDTKVPVKPDAGDEAAGGLTAFLTNLLSLTRKGWESRPWKAWAGNQD
jgi:hypothetical protein